MEYTVRWEIQLDAGSPEEAAFKALEVQRDPNSTANVFDVYWGEHFWGYDDEYWEHEQEVDLDQVANQSSKAHLNEES